MTSGMVQGPRIYLWLKHQLYARSGQGPGYDAAPTVSPDQIKLLLHILVKDAVLLADVVSHHRLPIWILLAVTALEWTDVGLLGGQLSRYPVLEVDPGQVILQMSVGILGGGLELADRTDLDSILTGVTRYAV